MEKKTVWIAMISGLIAGLVAALIMCTVCCNIPSRNDGSMRVFPARMEMMKHKMHHKHHGGPAKFHHKKGFHQFKEPTPEMKERFAQKLGLSDEQKATLEQYRKEDMAKMKPLFDEMDKVKGEIKELLEANRARFESVLTDEQKEILQKMMAKHHKHGFRGRDLPDAEDAPQSEVADEPTAEVEEAAQSEDDGAAPATVEENAPAEEAAAE